MTISEQARRHLDATVRAWLGAGVGESVPALPDDLAALLLRSEEIICPHRDDLGRWEATFADNHHRGTLWRPEIDEWLLAETGGAPPARWPEGRPFAVCLTHDVDRISTRWTPKQLARYIGLPLEPGMNRLRRLANAAVTWRRCGAGRPSTADSLERCLEIERRHGVTASYFFTVYPRRPNRLDCLYELDDPVVFGGRPCRVAEVMQAMAAEGFDVGLHGSIGSAADARVLAEERRRIERATGLTLKTTRQHYLTWHPARTPAVQAAAGISADSTVGYNRAVGFRAGTSLPYFLFDPAADRPLDVLEVPLTIQDTALLGAMGLDFALARKVVGQLLDRVQAVGGVATLLFHPDGLASPLTQAVYDWAVGECVRRGAWVTSLRQIDRWWRGRAYPPA